MFVLSVSKIDVEVLDLELLLYYTFKVCPSYIESYPHCERDHAVCYVSHERKPKFRHHLRLHGLQFDIAGPGTVA